MALYTYNGMLLTVGGLLAADIACCCPEDVEPCDIGIWNHLEFFDQTLDCVCLPDGPYTHEGPSWTTNTCEGNLSYTLSCDPVTGLPRLEVAGLGFATLVTNNPPTELVFQLPDLGANCGPNGGTATVRLTP